MGSLRKPASESTAARNRDALASLPPDDALEQEEARRGLVADFDPPRIDSESGRTVWELESYGFLDEEEPPDTAHPSLWRLARLNRIAGLFELAPGFFQLRGFDLSNMHVVEGTDGIVVIDPLVSAEVAAAALALYREHRGERPVTGLVYTHSHVDHFGGARGVLSEEEIERRAIPILAPAGFLHHAVSENVFAGTAMGRRAGYMYGALLERGADGQLGSGLGMTTSLGSLTLIPPNLEIAETGQEETIDGVRMSFQLTPGTEAPAEMNIHFPEARVLCVADNVARSMHNILTPRGALVRDPRVWAHYIDEAIELFGRDSEVMFSGHHWPAWGGERIVDLLEKQRDLYSYLHDQTLRLLNQGLTGPEIAERIELPPSLAAEWHCREYYGSVSHNVKAIYQRYMGWFDGNPAHLWQHEPVEAARRYVEAMGGAEAVLATAREAIRGGRLPLGRRGRQPPRLRRARERGGEAAAGRRARAARLRRRERDLAQLLPDGRQGAARGHLGDADLDRAARHRRPALGRPAARRDGDPARRPPRLGEAAADRLGRHRPRRGARPHPPQRRPQPPPRPPRAGRRRRPRRRPRGARRTAAQNRRHRRARRRAGA